ncbi:MAG: DUF3244 domain-containing protein [Bacteroidia bacterium]
MIKTITLVLSLFLAQHLQANAQTDLGGDPQKGPKRGGTKKSTKTASTSTPATTSSSDVGPINSPIDVYDAKALIGGNTLKWACQQNSDISDFMIQRSEDGQNFENVVRVAYTEQKVIDGFVLFEYMDNNPMEGKNYYRIVKNTYSGGYGQGDASRMLVVDNHYLENAKILPTTAGVITPAQEVHDITIGQTASVEFTPRTFEPVQVTITDEAGNVVQEKKMKATNFTNYSLDMKDVPSGNYRIRVFQGSDALEMRVNKR